MSSVEARSATEVEGKEKKFAGESALSSEGASSFTSFRQIKNNEPAEASEETALPDTFHWFAAEDWRGFRGKRGDYVDASTLPGGDLIASFKDFTVAARARVTGGQGTWRSILADGECEGFQLAIDDRNELVFEQPCHPNFVQTGFKPPLNEWFHVVVTYFQPDKMVAVFVNGERVSYAKTKSEFNLKTHMTIGRSFETESEYFIGDITAAQAFDYVLSPEQVKQIMKASAAAPGEAAGGLKNERRTTDGRICLTPCSAEEPAGINIETGANPTNVAIVLSCQDSLDNENFNGKTGQRFRITCPEDCQHEEGQVRGSRVYTSNSSICRAAVHAGVINREGGEAVVTLHNGLATYSGSRGHGGLEHRLHCRQYICDHSCGESWSGVVSMDECLPQLRSFSVSKASKIISLGCSDDASFVLKLGVKERELITCPPGCDKVTDSKVYGTTFYSPASSVCRAALHGGVLTEEGGEAEIEGGPQQDAFVGSEKHGIKSEKSGNYLRSFSFVKPTKAKHSAAQEF